MGLFSSGNYKVAEVGLFGATIASGLTETAALTRARDESSHRSAVVVVYDRNGDEVARFKSGRGA